MEWDKSPVFSRSSIRSKPATDEDQIERRVSGGLGVNEPSVRVLTSNGQPRVVVELPGFTSGNQAEAINTLLKTGNLEFWNAGPSLRGVLSPGSQFNPEQFAEYNPNGKAQFTGKDLDPGQKGVYHRFRLRGPLCILSRILS